MPAPTLKKIHALPIDLKWAELIFPNRRGPPRLCLFSASDILQKHRGDALLKISRAVSGSVLDSLIGIQVTPSFVFIDDEQNRLDEASYVSSNGWEGEDCNIRECIYPS